MYQYSANLVILFPVAVSLFVAIRLGEGMIVGVRTGWTRLIIYTTVGMMMAISIGGLLLRVGPLSLIWLAGIGAIFVIMLIRSRALNRSAIYLSLSTADTDLNRQMIAQDLIAHNSGSVRRSAQRFLLSLARLGDWAQAVELSRIAKTPYEKFTCRVRRHVGDDIDPLALSLPQPWRVQQETDRLLARMYPIPVAFFGCIIIGLLMWFVLPTFVEMQEEVGLDSQGSFVSLQILDWTIKSGFWLPATLAILVASAFAVFCLIAWIFPFLAQYYPLRFFTQAYYRSFGLLALSIAMKKQPDAGTACKTAATLVPVGFVSKQLKRAGRLIQEGIQPSIALSKVSLINGQQAALLGSAEKTKDFSWSIESLAIWTFERTWQFYSIFSQIALVISILLLALVYGLIARDIIGVLADMILQMVREL